MRSDPPFNSHEGYETRYMNPSDPKDIVEYKTDNALDSDIVATQAHYKAQQTKQDHDFDPTKFLAQTSEDNIEEALPQALSTFELAPQTSIPNSSMLPNSIAQEKSTTKTSVRQQAKSQAKVEAKLGAKSQTKAEKMNSFVSMRKKMMSNWGTK